MRFFCWRVLCRPNTQTWGLACRYWQRPDAVDGADPAGAGGDMLERLPPLGQQREAALAQAAHRADQRVPGPGINVELSAPGWLRHRHVNAMTCAFITRVGQHGHGVQERPQHPQDILPGRGQVMHIARQHIGNPQWDPGRVEQRLDVPDEASPDCGLISADDCWQDSRSGPYGRLHDDGRGAEWLWRTCASRPWIY
jgi:hypothetical protein